MPASGSGRIFELPSNGWCSKCLDKIVAEAGIQKKITFHAARHTFATTITLSQGVAIETISKLLGHKNIRTTQIYANITHSHISSEMGRLSKRIDLPCPDWTPSDTPNASKKALLSHFFYPLHPLPTGENPKTIKKCPEKAIADCNHHRRYVRKIVSRQP